LRALAGSPATLQPRRGIRHAVIDKFLDDQGGYLATLITYYVLVSLFELLLLLATVLGVLLAGHQDLQHQLLSSALRQFPVIGDQLGSPRGLSGGVGAVIVGIVGALHGGLRVGQAVQNAMDRDGSRWIGVGGAA
jgi:membrane protein